MHSISTQLSMGTASTIRQLVGSTKRRLNDSEWGSMMGRLSLAIALLAIARISPAIAETYVYDAVCEHSQSKQGEHEEDLTKQRGKPIACDTAVLAILENGRVLFQITEKTSHVIGLGFAGPRLDSDTSNFIKLPLDRIYLPHSDDSKSEKIDGIEGACFFDGNKATLQAITRAKCVAQIEVGTQRLVYEVQVHIAGIAAPEPKRHTAPSPASDAARASCLKLEKTHGFLTRAQFQCGFESYSSKMLEDARACAQTLTHAELDEQLKAGMMFFDSEEKAKGHAQICQDILTDFPSYVKR